MIRRAILLVLLSVGALHAEFAPDPSRLLADLPADHALLPIPVTVSLFLLDVTAVNGAEESFSGSIYLNFKWHDARLTFDAAKLGSAHALYTGAKAEEELQTIWSPSINVANLVGESKVEDSALTIQANGDVEYEMRLIGEFSSPMDLRQFPFDTQVLRITLESSQWSAQEVTLVASDESGHFNRDLAIRDWRLDGDTKELRAKVAPAAYGTGDVYSRYTAKLTVQRQPWFYMWSIVFPLVLVTFFAVTCFFWDENTLTERVAQTLTCLLTVTAESLVVSGELPKISYFTRIDYAFLLTYAVLLVVAVESLLVKSIAERNQALSDQIDSTCIWLVPLAYTAGMLAIFLLH